MVLMATYWWGARRNAGNTSWRGITDDRIIIGNPEFTFPGAWVRVTQPRSVDVVDTKEKPREKMRDPGSQDDDPLSTKRPH